MLISMLILGKNKYYIKNMKSYKNNYWIALMKLHHPQRTDLVYCFVELQSSSKSNDIPIHLLHVLYVAC